MPCERRTAERRALPLASLPPAAWVGHTRAARGSSRFKCRARARQVAGFPISTELSLGVVASTLSAGVAASLLLPEVRAAGEEGGAEGPPPP
jgi:hypothetical protein